MPEVPALKNVRKVWAYLWPRAPGRGVPGDAAAALGAHPAVQVRIGRCSRAEA